MKQDLAQSWMGARRRPMVMPFARALALLAAYTVSDRWLGTRELAERASLPASTTARIAKCLVALGYLHYDAQGRKYRLAASVLALGYSAQPETGLQSAARAPMLAFAEAKQMQVSLSSRERLDMVVLERCGGDGIARYFGPQVGTRLGIESSPLGCVFLAALPEAERQYLVEQVERNLPGELPGLRRRIGEAISQVRDVGYCASMGQSSASLAVVATPVSIDGHAPFVLATFGSPSEITRARIQRDVGPRLRATAETIMQKAAVA